MDILKETDQIIEILWQRIKYLYGDKSVGPMVRLQYNDVHFHGPTDWEGDQDSVSTRMPILRRWLRLQIAKNLKKYGHVFIYTCRDDSNLSFETPPDDLDLSLMNQLIKHTVSPNFTVWVNP